MDWNEQWKVGLVSILSSKKCRVNFTNIELIKNTINF